jgi:hypothetical protein
MIDAAEPAKLTLKLVSTLLTAVGIPATLYIMFTQTKSATAILFHTAMRCSMCGMMCCMQDREPYPGTVSAAAVCST